MYFQRRFGEPGARRVGRGEGRRLGNSWASLMMQTLLANLRLWTGRLSEAELPRPARAQAGFRELNDRTG